MEKAKNIIIIVLIFISTVLFFKQCNNSNTSPTKNEQEATRYFDAYLKQLKKTNALEKKADSLENNVKTVYIHKWKNRTKIETIATTNDTIIKIVSIAQTNEAICDTVINKLSETITAKDSVISSVKIEVKNLVISHDFKDKTIKSEKRKKNFWKIATGVVTVGSGFLLIK